MNQTKDDIWGLWFIILGSGFCLYGFSYFIKPLIAIVSGLLLIDQGLKYKNMPPLLVLIKYWFLKFR